MGGSKIEWCDATWNPVTGCKAISPGCANCFAARLAATRLSRQPRYKGLATLNDAGRGVWSGETILHPDRLDDPVRWKTPQRIFVCDMSDLFHEDVPDEYVLRVFDVMRRCTWSGGQGEGRIGGGGHTFQVLTKRAARMREFVSRLYFDGTRYALADAAPGRGLRGNPHIWLGVSVEDQARADERIPLLLGTPAAVRFLSCEPLLGPVNLRGHLLAGPDPGRCACGHGHGFTRCPNTGGVAPRCHHPGCGCPGLRRLNGIHWVIVGGESGPGARPCFLPWVRSLLAQCRAAGVSAFCKQLGSRPLADYYEDDPDHREWALGRQRRVLVPYHGNYFEHDCQPPPGAGAVVEVRLRHPKGGDPSEWPGDLRVREFPEVGR